MGGVGEGRGRPTGPTAIEVENFEIFPPSFLEPSSCFGGILGKWTGGSRTVRDTVLNRLCLSVLVVGVSGGGEAHLRRTEYPYEAS